MEVGGPVVDSHVNTYGPDVGVIVGEPVVGVLGALGFLQLDVGRLKLDQAFRFVSPNEVVAKVSQEGKLGP